MASVRCHGACRYHRDPPMAASPSQQKISALIEAGRYEQARAVLVGYLQRSPKDADGHAAMNLVLQRLGLAEQALFYGERAVALAPGNPNFLNNLGSTLVQLGLLGPALEAYERACALNPAHSSAHVGATDVLLKMQLPEQARARAEAALAVNPDEPRLIANWGSALVLLGRAAGAVGVYREGVRRFPGSEVLAAGLVSAGNYTDGVPPEEMLRAAQAYGLLLEAALPESLLPVGASGPEKRLRVGLLSSDFRAHAVGFFVDPFLDLAEAGGGAGFEVYCYHTSPAADAVTERLRKKVRGAGVWRSVPALGFTELAELIRRDRVDILIELSGLSAGHRLGTMRLKPAPVQVTAVGYPGTTGVRQIGWRIVDSITDPAGEPYEADRWCVERLLRLDPCFLCYRPPAETPAVREGRTGEGIVFGSFNGLPKLDDRTLRLWGAVLAASPGSRLVYKSLGMSDPAVRGATLERFVRAGIGPERLDVLTPQESAGSHLEQYGRLDVALDTYPYHGTTTTCEALLMGVPVVTLAGRMHVSRVGASLLMNAGLGDLVARDDEEFVRIAAGLAGDPSRLSALRAGLRERFLASPVCDAGAYTARLAAALRGVWREACAAGVDSERSAARSDA